MRAGRAVVFGVTRETPSDRDEFVARVEVVLSIVSAVVAVGLYVASAGKSVA